MDEKGDLAFNSLNHRRLLKRGIDDKGNGIQYNYHLNAFGEQLRLHVKRNTKFMAPDLQLESRDQDGRRTTRPVSENTFYVTGQVDSEPDSLVALSVGDGMVIGHLSFELIFKLKSNDFYNEIMPFNYTV